MVHLVGTVGEAEGTHAGVHPGQRRPVRHADAAVHLHGRIDDLAYLLGHECLHRAHPHAGFGIAQFVHRLRRLEHHEAHRFDVDAGPRDHLGVLAEAGERTSECLAGEATADKEIKGSFGGADGPHAVVDPARAEAHLGDLEAAAFTEEDVRLGDPDVVETDVQVAVRGIVFTEDGHGAELLDTGRVGRNEDLRLSLVGRSVGVGDDHHDHDLAARIASARGPVLLAVDEPLLAVEHGERRDVLRIG